MLLKSLQSGDRTVAFTVEMPPGVERFVAMCCTPGGMESKVELEFAVRLRCCSLARRQARQALFASSLACFQFCQASFASSSRRGDGWMNLRPSFEK